MPSLENYLVYQKGDSLIAKLKQDCVAVKTSCTYSVYATSPEEAISFAKFDGFTARASSSESETSEEERRKELFEDIGNAFLDLTNESFKKLTEEE